MKDSDKKEKHRFRNMWKALSMELREHKSSFMVYFVLRLLVIIVMILQIFNQNYENVFLCILTLLLLVIPSLVQVTMKIELPTTLEIIILVFIFAAGDTGVLYRISVLGYRPAHAQRIPCGCNWIFVGGSPQPQ